MLLLEEPPDLQRPYECVPQAERNTVMQRQLELRRLLDKLTNTRPDDPNTYARYAAQVIGATPGLELPADFDVDAMPPLRPDLLSYYRQLFESGTIQNLRLVHECKPGNHTWIPLAPIFPVTVTHHTSNESHCRYNPTQKEPYWVYDVLISEADNRAGVDTHRTKANVTEGVSIFGLHPQVGSMRVASPQGFNSGEQVFFTNGTWDSSLCNDLVHPGMVIADSNSYKKMFKAPPNDANIYANYRHHHEVWIGGRCGAEAPAVNVE